MQPRSTRFNKGHKARRQILEVHNPAHNAGGPCPLLLPRRYRVTGALSGLAVGVSGLPVACTCAAPQLPRTKLAEKGSTRHQAARGGFFFFFLPALKPQGHLRPLSERAGTMAFCRRE